MNPKRLQIYLLLLLTTAIWGIAGPVIKYTLSWFDPDVFLIYRFFVSSLLAFLISIIVGFKLPKSPKLIFWVIVYCFITSTVALGILFLGYKETTAIDAGLIGATAPLFISVAGVIFLKEHLTKREKIGIGVAFLGTAITIFEPIFKNGYNFSSIQGNLLVLFSVIIGTVSAVLAKLVIRERVRPVDLTSLTFLVGFVTILPIALMQKHPGEIITQITHAPFGYHLGVLYMAVLSGTLAYFLWARAEKSIEIGEVGVFAYLYPLFGTPVSVIWLKEQITIPFIIGALVIATGVIIAEWKKR